MVKNMKQTSNYILLKKSIYKKVVSYEFNESFTMSKRKDDKRIGVIKFYDEKIINQVIQRSIDNRFRKLLELISSIDEEDGDPSEGLLICLNEIDKFKKELINKYNKFLKKAQIELINKKLELTEKEIKTKIMAYRLIRSPMFKDIMDEEIVEERKRSR